MRVTAGEFKGRRLVAPRGRRTRPTADQVRLAVMDALGPWLEGARVLDLYAGAGGVGLEALSRGAAHATFVERDPEALRALWTNIRALGLASRARVLRQEVGRAVEGLGRAGERFSIVYLDPPYLTEVDRALDRVGRAGLATPGGVVIAQHLTKRPPAERFEGLVTSRTRRFGETTLTFFRVAPAVSGE